MRYKITLSYDGSAFCGWQIQSDAPSVQQSLETALGTLLGSPIKVTGAGRTDTAVNAQGYVAHFDCPGEVSDTGDLCYKLNAILPREIAVSEICRVPDDFHARFDAKRREYTYYLHRKKDPFAAKFSWLCAYPDLDMQAMNLAAQHLLGTHDFKCFEKSGGDNKTSICTVFEACWRESGGGGAGVDGACRRESGGSDVGVGGACESGVRDVGVGGACESGVRDVGVGGACESDHWEFHIAADRFLRNMVRAIVGTLIEVGRGKRTPESIDELIARGTRSDSGESVPGHALFLTKIEY